MQSKAKTPKEYINSLPADRKAAIVWLRKVILKNLPKGFAEVMNYGMIGYVIPHSLYPKGYHCDPKQPLPFMSIASQKNFIAVYHMGLYADKQLLKWFTAAYAKHYSKGMDTRKKKLEMGKSCLRFNKLEQIPFELIGELAGKVTPKKWIEVYEKHVKR